MKATLCIDDAVGEYRRALLDASGRPFRLEVERWSERGQRARLDEIWWGRVKARMPGNRGWFVDLGLTIDGVMEPTRAAAVTEGALLAVRVKSEAWADKGPVLSLADMSAKTPKPDKPTKRAGPDPDPFLHGVEILATVSGQDARRHVEAAVEEAGQRLHPLVGGGDIAIDATRGLTAIDVDGGSRSGGSDAEAFALALNLTAARETARQIALRGVGGLIVVDFVGMESPPNQRAVIAAFRETLAALLGRASKVPEMSPLGVCEAAIARRSRPVEDAIAILPAEREALDALREIETAGMNARAARICARVSADAARWLEAETLGLKVQLAGRIGARWSTETETRPAGKPQVWSV
ncbi:MAG: ribonuclease E/G [Hyphomonadaceae bacterium]